MASGDMMPAALKELKQELKRIQDVFANRVHVINDNELAKFFYNLHKNGAVPVDMLNY